MQKGEKQDEKVEEFNSTDKPQKEKKNTHKNEKTEDFFVFFNYK